MKQPEDRGYGLVWTGASGLALLCQPEVAMSGAVRGVLA
jgi:hypothetical protein